jgi:hypothetical protein
MSHNKKHDLHSLAEAPQPPRPRRHVGCAHPQHALLAPARSAGGRGLPFRQQRRHRSHQSRLSALR